MLVRVGNELLEDHLEARVARLPPDRRGLVGVVRDDGLVPEAERVLLALRRLQEKGRLEIRRANRLLALGENVAGAGTPASAAASGSRSFRRRRRTISGSGGSGTSASAVDLVPVAQDELDVLVALRHEHRASAVRQRAEVAEHPAVARRLVVLGRDAAAAEVARPEAELVPAEDASVHGDPRAAETAREREPGRQQAEHEHGPAVPFRQRGQALNAGHYAALAHAACRQEPRREPVPARDLAPVRAREPCPHLAALEHPDDARDLRAAVDLRADRALRDGRDELPAAGFDPAAREPGRGWVPRAGSQRSVQTTGSVERCSLVPERDRQGGAALARSPEATPAETDPPTTSASATSTNARMARG